MTAVSTMRLSADPMTDKDLLRLVYGGGHRELVDGCLVIRREVGHYTGGRLHPRSAAQQAAADARYGIGIYLLVDPLEPVLTVLVLDGADYVETARGAGDEVVRVGGPIGLELSAAQLVRD